MTREPYFRDPYCAYQKGFDDGKSSRKISNLLIGVVIGAASVMTYIFLWEWLKVLVLS